MIERHEIGWHVAQGDVDRLTDILTEAAALLPETRAAMGYAAGAAIASHYSKSRLCAEFCDIVESTVSPAPVTIPAPAEVG